MHNRLKEQDDGALMSIYEQFSKDQKKRNGKKPGFFTPYDAKNTLGAQVASVFSSPLQYGLIAVADEFWAAVHFIGGVFSALSGQESETINQFNTFGNHFGGFVLAASLAITSFFIEAVKVFTRIVATCSTQPSNQDKVNEEQLESSRCSC